MFSHFATMRYVQGTKQFCSRVDVGSQDQYSSDWTFQAGKSRGILNRLEKSGEITGKLEEFQTNISSI